MKNLLTFIGGVAVGVLAVTGIYALDDELPATGCEADTETGEVDDPGEESVDDRLEELLEPDGS
ncbi:MULTISPECIES: hypothetical protein [unclassified Maridesulfovibrio]|uniref:hypothetical protein n=1 Tax=unclassified Maridesulfovibrio TaxID=2794999 RepID=UPI003B4138EB